MSIYDIELTLLDGQPTSPAAWKGRTVLVVNVASRCGFTPQYTGLQQLQDTYGPRGLTVIGFPCNQFGAQEPGSAEEIATFCSANYAVTFPVMSKIEVNGEGRHPLYRILTETPDAAGEAGDVKWNFEKFLIAPSGEVAARFRSATEPESPELIAAIEKLLPAAG